MKRPLIYAAPMFVALAYACGGASMTDGAPPPDGGEAETGGDGAVDATGDGAASDASSPFSGDAWMMPAMDASAILAARPYQFHVSNAYDPAKAAPLVVMFHGYSASAIEQEFYFQLVETSDANGFLYAYGDGTLDPTGNRFWNADDACCDIYHAGINDIAYFDAIVGDVKSKYNVDPKRIYVVGHSNGGFMSHRLACDRAGTVAAIVSLAGAVWDDPTRCTPSEHVSIAEVHGNADTVIVYTGGSTPEGSYPPAPTTVATWAQKNGCTGALADTGKSLDLDTVLLGAETKVEAYAGCPAGISVELWTIQGGAHVPNLAHPNWGDAMWSFMSAHAKP